MKFIDLFSGIGGFRLGMEAAGHKCVGWVEIDKFARQSYQAIHDTKGEWTASDIREVTDDDIRELGRARGKIQVICGGFPCQAFSVAGKRGGFSDTRGTLFFEIARFASILRPDYLFLENVTGLLSHDNGSTFETILRTLDELGYRVEWQVLNSKDFGVPQNRERVFIIGHLGGGSGRTVFPIRGENPNTINQLGNIDQSGREWDNPQTGRVYDPAGVAPCLNTMQGGGREPKIALHLINKQGDDVKLRGDITNCHVPMTIEKPAYIPGPQDTNNTLRNGGKGRLTAKHNYEHIHDGYRIRKLTPRECWRLQGFPDWAFDMAAKVVSNSQLYKQAGNSVTVNVIRAIAERLTEVSQ